MRVALTGTVFRLYRLDGSEFARSTIPRLKVEYQPSASTVLPGDRGVPLGAHGRRSSSPATRRCRCSSAGAAQPATEFNGLRLDLLASFEPTPGTVAFLGYGSSLETDAEFNWSRLQRVNDGFFVKLAYVFRR